MNASELREKSSEELQAQLVELLKDQFNLRIQKATGNLGQTHLLSANQRDVARIKTIMSEKAKQEKAGN